MTMLAGALLVSNPRLRCEASGGNWVTRSERDPNYVPPPPPRASLPGALTLQRITPPRGTASADPKPWVSRGGSWIENEDVRGVDPLRHIHPRSDPACGSQRADRLCDRLAHQKAAERRVGRVGGDLGRGCGGRLAHRSGCGLARKPNGYERGGESWVRCLRWCHPLPSAARTPAWTGWRGSREGCP